MEQTLGKRITENRKRLGLTQDRLAEQLGVTAQAVSKWENDQSCPDITTLPKLAEIFGISTDALLGIEKVSQCALAAIETEAEESGEPEQGRWEFKYDGGRKSKLGMAVWVLLAGALLLAAHMLNRAVSFWDIAWPSALCVFGFWGLYPHFSFFRLGCGLLGSYRLLNVLNLMPFSLGKELLLPIFLLLFGMSLLMDALRSKKQADFTIVHDGKTVYSKKDNLTSNYSEDGECFDCSLSFGSETRHVGLPLLTSGDIDVSFGELTVDLTGVAEFSPNCSLEADCSFGKLTILLPKNCRAIPSTDTAFAAVKFYGSPDPQPAYTVKTACDVAFGEVRIQYC